MTEQTAIAYLKIVDNAMKIELSKNGQSREKEINDRAFEKAIKAMEAQTKLKECIANLDNPEFEHLTWSHEELLKLLKEHVADYTERS